MSTVIRLPAPTSAATWRALARDAHREAVRLNLAGDHDGYIAKLVDVRAFDDKATEARRREENLELDQWRRDEERRRTAAALDRILELAAKDRERNG